MSRFIIKHSSMHRYAMLQGKILDSHDLDFEKVNQLRQYSINGALKCLLCHESLIVLPDNEEGWGFMHAPGSPYHNHQVETAAARAARKLVANHLDEIFPTAIVDQAVPIFDTVLDIVLITPEGGKLGVEILRTPLTRTRLRVQEHTFKKNGVVMLYLLLADNLTLKPMRKDSKFYRHNVDETQTALLAENKQLWYIDPRGRRLLTIHVPPEVQQLAKDGMKKIGSIPVLVRQYHISNFRLRSGLVATFADWDPKLPTEWEPLPDRLLKKIKKD